MGPVAGAGAGLPCCQASCRRAAEDDCGGPRVRRLLPAPDNGRVACSVLNLMGAASLTQTVGHC